MDEDKEKFGCAEITDDVLLDYARGKLDERQRPKVHSHLQECEPCRSRAQEVGLIGKALRESAELNEDIPVPESVDKAVFATISEVSRSQRRTLKTARTLRWLVPAAAAVILVVVIVGFFGSAERGVDLASPGRSANLRANKEACLRKRPVAATEAESPRGVAMDSLSYNRVKPLATPAEVGLRVSFEYVDVSIETEGKKLGAYDLIINFDPSIVHIARVEPAPEGGFPGTPVANPNSFARGTTKITGIQTGEGKSSEHIAVARVYFKPVSAGKSKIKVEIKSLYDPNSKRISGTAVLSANEITVTK